MTSMRMTKFGTCVFPREEPSVWRRAGTEETSSWRGRDEPERANRDDRRDRDDRRGDDRQGERRDREQRPAPRDEEGEQTFHS